ncbi:hypothetical protein D3C71_1164980 [compost metagenome]
MGERDVDPLGLFPNDVDFLDARHMQQLLAQHFRVADQLSLGFTLGLEGEERKGHVCIFVVDHRADNASRQFPRLVADLLASLVELLLHLRRRCAVQQRHHGESQAGAGEGFCAVVPAQFLHALFQGFCNLILHLLGRGARPRRNDRHLLDGERRVFSAPEFGKRENACCRDQEDQEQGDGALAHCERRQVETAFAHGRAPSFGAAVARSASRTCSPSRNRCAPSATIRSPGLMWPVT